MSVASIVELLHGDVCSELREVEVTGDRGIVL